MGCFLYPQLLVQKQPCEFKELFRINTSDKDYTVFDARGFTVVTHQVPLVRKTTPPKKKIEIDVVLHKGINDSSLINIYNSWARGYMIGDCYKAKLIIEVEG